MEVVVLEDVVLEDVVEVFVVVVEVFVVVAEEVVVVVAGVSPSTVIVPLRISVFQVTALLPLKISGSVMLIL